jgi:hypothetical protein
MAYRPGDIVNASVPFQEDRLQSKLRPNVILEVVDKDIYLVAAVSTSLSTHYEYFEFELKDIDPTNGLTGRICLQRFKYMHESEIIAPKRYNARPVKLKQACLRDYLAQAANSSFFINVKARCATEVQAINEKFSSK